MTRNWLRSLPSRIKAASDKVGGSLLKIFGLSNGDAAVRRKTMTQKWLQPVYTAWVGVATHKLRSSLTILGVVIGVAAVISLMSVGRGTQARIISSIQNMGSNLLFVSPGTTTAAGGVRSFGSATTLTLDDARVIAEEAANVAAVAPTNRAGLQVVAGSSNVRSNITGVTPEYQQVLNLQLAEGDFITEYQYQSGMRVAVLGSKVRTTLFADGEAVGQQMRVGNMVVQVIGVLQGKGRSMLGDADEAIYIPLTTLRQTVTAQRTATGAYTVNQIIVSLSDRKYSKDATAVITSLLRYTHRLQEGQDNDFTVTSQEDVVATITAATSGMTMLLGAIAAISLLVGGIGVMNIMLVSVIERTREIGIRKALGAQERDIWTQFLIEASILTLTGGVIGVIVGWVVSALIQRLGNTTTLVSADIIILAISVSIGIGVFFGFYPAWQASRLNPIDALRSE